MADRFELYYGAPGSAKTRSIMTLIEQMHEESGKEVRVYTGDGSGAMYKLHPLYKAGKIHLLDFTIREYPFTTCQFLCEGYWPLDVAVPNSKLTRLTPDQVQKTGMWVFEGMAVMGDYMMGDQKGALSQRAADGEIIGQDANIRISDPKFGDQAMNFAGNAGAHYNLGQRHLHANIIRTKAFPGDVIWTTHERIDDGERGGAFVKGAANDKVKVTDKCIGPELIGKALTSNISRDFGNTLHFIQASKKEAAGQDPVTGKTVYKEKTEYRIYTREHYDPDGIVGLKYIAINRSLNPTKVKDFYSSPIETPGKGLLDFYNDLKVAQL